MYIHIDIYILQMNYDFLVFRGIGVKLKNVFRVFDFLALVLREMERSEMAFLFFFFWFCSEGIEHGIAMRKRINIKWGNCCEMTILSLGFISYGTS